MALFRTYTSPHLHFTPQRFVEVVANLEGRPARLVEAMFAKFEWGCSICPFPGFRLLSGVRITTRLHVYTA